MCSKLHVQLERKGHKRDPRANNRSLGYESSLASSCANMPHAVTSRIQPHPRTVWQKQFQADNIAPPFLRQNTSYSYPYTSERIEICATLHTQLLSL